MNSEEKCNEEQPSCQEGVHRISESSLDTTMSKNLRSATQVSLEILIIDREINHFLAINLYQSTWRLNDTNH